MSNEPKLVQFLKSISHEERVDVKKYIAAMHGKNNDCYTLFSYVVNKTEGSQTPLEAPVLLSRVLPHSSLKSVSNYLSLLLGYCEDWLVLQTIKKDKLRYHNVLVEAYLHKELHDHADHHIKRLEDDFESKQGFNIEKKMAKAEMYRLLFFSGHPFRNTLKSKAMDLVMQSYIEVVHYSLLLYRVELKNWGTIHSADYSHWHATIDAITSTEQSAEMEFIRKLGDIQAKPDLFTLQSLDQQFGQGLIDIHSRVYIDTVDYLRLAGVRLYRQNKNVDINFTIQKYVQRLEYMEENALPMGSALMGNITSQLSLIYSFEETKAFIDKWIFLVNAMERNVTLLKCYAANCLYHERYDEMSKYILGKEFKTLDDKFTANIYQLIYLYMTSDRDILEIKVKNFSYFVKRKASEIGDNKYKRYMNFAQFITAMIKKDYQKAEQCLNHEISFRTWCSKEIKKQKGPDNPSA